MSERSIGFSDEQIRALLAGTKTQTRRVLRFPKHTYLADPTAAWVKAICEDGGGNFVGWSTDQPGVAEFTKKAYPTGGGFPCPFGRPGDVLWVKEAWRCVALTGALEEPDAHIYYRAGGCSGPLRADWHVYTPPMPSERWFPARTMPRWASRLTLEITSVRAERLQAISEDDAEAEGAEMGANGQMRPLFESYWEAFAMMWDADNARYGHSWASNPFVWVLGIRRKE